MAAPRTRTTSKRKTPLKLVGGSVTSKPKPGSVDYEAALRTKPIEDVECRGMRHAWTLLHHSRLTNPATKRDLPMVQVDLICSRGGHSHPIRHEWLVVKKIVGTKNEYRVVERLRATYSYPEGYQMRGVVRGAKPMASTWEELLRRESAMVVYADEPKQTRKDRA